MPSHSFAALTALVVRRINGDVTLFVRLVNGFATDQGLPVPAARTPPVGALACAPGSGTLPPFAALTALVVRRVNSGVALVVRRVNGFADRPRLACAGRPHAPRRGIGVRTRQRHLAARACCAPRKWPLGLLYCVNGFADRPMPACTGRPHAPRRGIGVRTRQRHLAAAPGSGTLPPHGQKKTSSCVRSNLR